jgi:hypothetical protein
MGTMPSPRFSHNAMYDSAQHRMLIWSGQGAELYNDVWAFNLTTYTWQELWHDGNVSGAPLKRYGTAAVFDPLTRRLVNFAGFTTSGRFDDTWTFDVDNKRWTDQTANPRPLRRCLHSASFAHDRHQMILYGGQSSDRLDDVWSLDLDTYVWSNLTPATRPAGRYFPSNVYAGNGNVIIFGGETNQGPSAELWKFSLSSNSWESLAQGNTRPSARSSHAAIYVPSQHKMIIFGGVGSGLFNDTWEYSITSSEIEVIYDPQPTTFSLEQNYPNPFNPATRIEFRVPDFTFVSLKVYDLLGREVTTLVNEWKEAGIHTVIFDIRNSSFAISSSGVYIYRLQAGEYVQQKTMVLVK